VAGVARAPEGTTGPERYRGELRIQLLGGFKVWVDGVPIPDGAWRRRRAASLFKLLALAPGNRIHREEVLERLWPEFSPEAAQNNLHRTLWTLRHALTSGVSGVEPGHVRLQNDVLILAPDGELRSDVKDFVQAATPAHGAEDAHALEAAVALYAGDLLPDDRYEDWVTPYREELRRLYHGLLWRLSGIHASTGNRGRAIEVLHLLIASEPVEEDVYAELMRLYTLNGQRHEAVRQYQQLCEVLRREVDAEPDAQTQTLYAEIQSGRFPTRSNARGEPTQEGQAAASAVAESAVTGGSPPNNLPRHLSSFVGRRDDIAAIQSLLSSNRLVTLVGVGGMGKSRLAMQVATENLAAYPDGVWLVELAALADADSVTQTIAGVLGVDEQPDRPAIEVVANALRTREALLILDNCEHLLEATCAVVDVLLRECAGLHILTTSRRTLGGPDETVWHVSSLRFPGPDDQTLLDSYVDYDAIQLFVERAQAARSTFTLTARNALAVVAVCERLDGIPLVLELAAARMRVLSVEQLASRLDDCFAALGGGSTSPLPRHRTLEAAMDWSFELLSEGERVLFRRLAVFAGGWTLEAAEHICSGQGVAERDVLDGLAALVDHSLVVVEERDTAMHYYLLEPVRQYAAVRLADAGERDMVQGRHAAWFVELAERAEPHLTGSEQLIWKSRLEDDLDNLRAALRWALDNDHDEIGAQLAGALWRFWYQFGHTVEGRRWLDGVLARIDRDQTRISKSVLARAVFGAGGMAYTQNDHARAAPLLEESYALFREAEDKSGMALALNAMAALADQHSERAMSLYEAGLALYRELGDIAGQALLLNNLAILAASRGEYQRAAEQAEESLTLNRRLGDRWGMGVALSNLGDFMFYLGDLDRATALQEQSLALKYEIGDALTIPQCLVRLGDAALERGDDEAACALFRETVERCRELGVIHEAACAMEGLAVVIARAGEATRAARLLAAVESVVLDDDSPPGHRSRSARRVAIVRKLLDEATFEAASTQGEALSFEQAEEEALRLACGVGAVRQKRATLTPRERDVAALIAQDRTNRQIAAELGMSPETVRVHVRSIFKKLGVASRREIGAWTLEHLHAVAPGAIQT
jgi:predicted ATPase/DNA-binding SARP family transcriptional activator/DNA-binding CsgD family transcriptional regulator